MTTIRQQDFIDSIADSLQYISYYHPADYIKALGDAYEREQSAAAKDAIAQILTNSRMCAEGHRPICQDTGIVCAFVKVGMDVKWADVTMSIQDMVNEGVRQAYNHPDNKLRASVLADPAGARKNTRDNTPAIVHFDLVPGNTVDVSIAAKGGGSENKSKFVMLNPSDSIVDWVLKTVPAMGAGWCPPGMLGIGIGGTAEKAMLLAKQSLMDHIDIQDLIARGPQNRIEELRIELYQKVNALGIGAQGLGGLSTVLDVKILDYPTHAASARGETLPVDFANRFIYYVGPVDPVRDEVVGPAGPTTATRMDKFTRQMLEQTGLLGMVGKAERGQTAIDAIKDNHAVYLMAVGGAAYLVSKAIKAARVVAFEDLGMEAIYEFDVQDMPVTVAVDSQGTSVHQTGPAEWQKKISLMPNH